MSNLRHSDRLQQVTEQLQQELASSGDLAGDWVRRAARVLIEQMLAAEVDEALGRASYERRGEGQAGYRNGFKPRSIKTAQGKVAVDLPQVRGLTEPYQSAIWAALGSRRTPALEKLAVEMYVRGLSTRDIEDLLKEFCDQSEQTLLSKSSVSRVSDALMQEYQEFCKRDLNHMEVVYLFCDAVYESLRSCGMTQGILVTWAICSNGAKVLLHMSTGSKESKEAWLEHLRSLVSRNLAVPLTVTTDGAPGLIAAVEAMWPESERIRCWFHKMQNILDKVPESMRETIKRLLVEVRDAPDYQSGKDRAKALIKQYERELPSATTCVADDLEASLAHLKLPSLHQKSIRTTNLAERGFVEERRRSKVIPHFFDEQGCLKLVYATMIRASNRWRMVRFNKLQQQQLDNYIRARNAMGKKVREIKAA